MRREKTIPQILNNITAILLILSLILAIITLAACFLSIPIMFGYIASALSRKKPNIEDIPLESAIVLNIDDIYIYEPFKEDLKNTTFSSTNEEIASVTYDGKVITHGFGKCRIIARNKNYDEAILYVLCEIWDINIDKKIGDKLDIMEISAIFNEYPEMVDEYINALILTSLCKLDNEGNYVFTKEGESTIYGYNEKWNLFAIAKITVKEA